MSLMVGLTRVYGLAIPLWDGRNRHCGAKVTVAHLSTYRPATTWYRGVSAVHAIYAVCGGIRGRIPTDLSAQCATPPRAAHALTERYHPMPDLQSYSSTTEHTYCVTL